MGVFDGHWDAGAFVLLVVGIVVLVWFVRSFMIPVSGTWERADTDGGHGVPERISFFQFGPIVRGRRMVPGGFQEFSGILRGRTMFLIRRDHGVKFIQSQGFPVEVAPLIDGTVTAKLRLTLSADRKAIFGTFTPQKIEFTVRPAKITARPYLEPGHRRYRLLSRDLGVGEESQDLHRVAHRTR